MFFEKIICRPVDQLVECLLCEQNITGSNPVLSAIFKPITLSGGLFILVNTFYDYQNNFNTSKSNNCK